MPQVAFSGHLIGVVDNGDKDIMEKCSRSKSMVISCVNEPFTNGHVCKELLLQEVGVLAKGP